MDHGLTETTRRIPSPPNGQDCGQYAGRNSDTHATTFVLMHRRGISHQTMSRLARQEYHRKIPIWLYPRGMAMTTSILPCSIVLVQAFPHPSPQVVTRCCRKDGERMERTRGGAFLHCIASAASPLSPPPSLLAPSSPPPPLQRPGFCWRPPRKPSSRPGRSRLKEKRHAETTDAVALHCAVQPCRE